MSGSDARRQSAPVDAGMPGSEALDPACRFSTTNPETAALLERLRAAEDRVGHLEQSLAGAHAGRSRPADAAVAGAVWRNCRWLRWTMKPIDPETLAVSLRRLAAEGRTRGLLPSLHDVVEACVDLFGVSGSGIMLADEQNI